MKPNALIVLAAAILGFASPAAGDGPAASHDGIGQADSSSQMAGPAPSGAGPMDAPSPALTRAWQFVMAEDLDAAMAFVEEQLAQAEQSGALPASVLSELWWIKCVIHEVYGEQYVSLDALEQSLRVDASGASAEARWVRYFASCLELSEWKRLETFAGWLLANGNPDESLPSRIRTARAYAMERMGNIPAASELYKEAGCANSWRVTGPFNGVAGSGFERAFAPELDSDTEKVYADDWGIERRWRVFATHPSAWVDLAAHYGAAGDLVCYGATSVRSPAAAEAWMHVGIAGAARIWLNGEEVLTGETSRYWPVDLYSVPVRLREGWNSVLVKVQTDEEMPAGFALRLENRDRTALAGITWDATRKLDPLASDPGPQPVREESCYWTAYDQLWQHYGEHPSLAQAILICDLADIGDFEIQCLEHLDVLSPSGRPAILLHYMEDLYRATDRTRGAASVLAELSRANPDILTAVVYESGQLRAAGRGAEASSRLRDYVSAHPRSLYGTMALIAQLGESGATSELYDAQRALEELAPDFPLAILMLAQRKQEQVGSTEFKRHAEERWDKNPIDETLQALVSEAYAQDGDVAGMRRMLERLTSLLPADPRWPLSLAGLMLNTGDFPSAESWCRRALELAPDGAQTLAMMGTISRALNHLDAARSWFSQALRQSPDAWDLRNEIAALSGDAPTTDQFLDEATQYFIAADRANPAYPGDHGYYVLADAQLLVTEDLASKYRLRVIGRVNDEVGTREMGQLTLGAPSRAFGLEFKKIVTIKPDGTVVPGKASGNAVSFAELCAGDYFELILESYISCLSAMGRDLWFSLYLNMPESSACSRFQLVRPKDVALEIQEPTAATVEHQAIDGTLVRTVWTARNLERQGWDSRTPDSSARPYLVDLSTIDSWSEVGAWYERQTHRQRTPTAMVAAKAEEIVAGCGSDTEKALALSRFVARVIAYSNPQFQFSALDPTAPETVLERGIGDCKDQVTLLLSLAKAVGIEGRMALVLSSADSDYPYLPSIRFDHVIACLETSTGRLWVDPTMTYFDPSAVPDYLQGRQVLLLDGAESALVRIPMSAAEESMLRLCTIVHVDGAGQGVQETSVTATVAYAEAAFVAATTNTPAELEQWLEVMYGAATPGLNITEITLPDAARAGAVAEYRFAGRRSGMVTPVGNRVVLQAPFQRPLDGSVLSCTQNRRSALDVTDLFGRESERVEVHMTGGAHAVDLPSAVELDCPEGHYRLTVVETPDGSLVFERDLTIRVKQVSEDRVAAFGTFVAAVMAADRSAVLVEFAQESPSAQLVTGE